MAMPLHFNKTRMNWKSIFLILTALALAFPAWANDETAEKGPCDKDLSAVAQAVPSHLTLDEAYVIIGQSPLGIAGPQLARALQYIQSLTKASFAQKAQDLETLCQAIRESQVYTWDFRKFHVPDGSVGFVGDLGPFILLRPDGRLFRGQLNPKKIDYYDQFKEKFEEIYEVVPR